MQINELISSVNSGPFRSMDKEAAEAVATEIRLRLVLKILMDTDRNERFLSYLQEATEQEGNTDLTSRLAMQLRPESSLTSVLPLQPLNENQLLIHAAERQAVPSPKRLANQLNDVISSVIPVLTGVAFIARCLYGVLLCYRLGTTGRSASSWEPAWEDMKTWPSNVICIFYCCKVTISDYFCAQVIWPGMKDLLRKKILQRIKYGWQKLIRGIKYLSSKLCQWMKQEREDT